MLRLSTLSVLIFLSGLSALSLADAPAKSSIPGIDFTKPGPSPTPSPSLSPLQRSRKRKSRDKDLDFGVDAAGGNQGYSRGAGKVKVGF